MARGTAQEAKQNAGAGASQNATYSGRANDAFNAVFPQLQNQAQNGLPQADQAALNTASQQSIGGSNAEPQDRRISLQPVPGTLVPMLRPWLSRSVRGSARIPRTR
jgi:hypothetical protein